MLTLDKASYSQGLKDAESEGQSSASSIGNALSSMGTAITTSLAAAATAVAGLTTSAVTNYADYEQLVGGVEKLFGEDANAIIENASNAWQTAGMSANEYMETVTSFSASLIQSLGGDTEAAVEYADMALSDMSDNANTFGTDMASIQNAYQGFAKGNYTMLDNLKLGYGGTATEMERLITDAEGLDSSFTAARDSNGDLAMSYSDIVKAINIVQKNMNITGTTAKEASKTISGSINSMKSAWTNFVTGLGDDNADIALLVDNLTESLTNVVDNVGPTVVTILENITEAIPGLVESVGNLLSSVVPNLLPKLISAASSLMTQLASSLPDLVGSLLDSLPDVIVSVFGSGGLLQGIAESLGSVLLNLPTMLVDTISGIATGVTDLFKEDTEESVNDTFFSGTQSRLESSFAKMVEDAQGNFREAWANLTGNELWAEAEGNLDIALTFIDDFDEEYEDWKTAYSETVLEAQTKGANIKSKLKLLVGGLNGDGYISADEYDYATELAEEINQYLPEDSQIELTPQSAEIQLILDSVGEGMTEEDIIAKFKEEHPEFYDGTLSADAVSVVTDANIACNQAGFGDNYEDATTWLNEHGSEYGLTAADITTLCDILATPEGMAAWSSTEYGSFKEYLEASLKTDEAVDAQISFIMQEAESGKSVEEIIADLDEAFPGTGASDRWSATITYAVENTGDKSIEELIQDLDDWVAAEIRAKTIDLSLDYIFDSIQDVDTILESVTEHQEDFNKSLEEGNDDAARTNYKALIEDYQAIDAECKSAEEAEYAMAEAMADNADEVKNGTVSRQEYIDSYLEESTVLDEVYEKRDAAKQQLLEDAAALGDINGLTTEHIALMSAAGISVEEITTAVTGNSDAYNLLNSVMEENWLTFKNQPELIDEIVRSDSDLMATLDEMGISVDTFTLLMKQMIQEEMSAIPTAGELGIAFEDLGTSGEEAAQKLVEAAEAAGVQLPDYLRTGVENGTLTLEDALKILGVDTADAYKEGYEEEAEANPVEQPTPTVVEEEVTEVGASMADDVKEGYDAESTANPIEADAPTADTAGATQAGTDTANAYEEGYETAEAANPIGDGEAPTADTDTANDAGVDTLDAYNTGIASMKDTVAATIKIIQALFNAYLGSNSVLPVQMKTWGSSAANGFNTGLSGKVSTISTTAQSLATAAKNAVSYLYNPMYLAGAQGGNGLAAGLSAKWWAVYNAAASLASAASSGAYITLRVSSPSKVFREIGDYAGQGLALGMLDEIENVEAASSELANAAITDVETNVSYSSIDATAPKWAQDLSSQIANIGIYLDGDTLVGQTINRIDSGLETLSNNTKRNSGVFAW